MMVLKDSPSAGTASARECDARNCFDEGGLPRALPANNSDGRNIQVYVGSITQVGKWRGAWGSVTHPSAHTRVRNSNMRFLLAAY
jgi:hypothetical protein